MAAGGFCGSSSRQVGVVTDQRLRPWIVGRDVRLRTGADPVAVSFRIGLDHALQRSFVDVQHGRVTVRDRNPAIERTEPKTFACRVRYQVGRDVSDLAERQPDLHVALGGRSE